MAILRRNKQFTKLLFSAVSFLWLERKQRFMFSGMIEEDLSKVTSAKIGSLKDPRYDIPSLLSRLYRYKKSLMYTIFSLRDSSTLARVCAAIDDLETDVSDGTFRKQPFCILLYGFPGTGKSSLAVKIARALMTDKHGEFNSRDMVTLNESDEFQSEYRCYHKVVVFDDIGASKCGLNDTKNPWTKVIDFVNNIKKTVLNPNVDVKGKVYIEPELVILTSNLDFQKGGKINHYIPAFEAILRRVSRIVKVVDYTTVHPLLFDKTHIQIDTESHMTYRPRCEFRGDPISSTNYIQELRDAYRKHDADQTLFVDHINSYFDDYVCDEPDILFSQSSGLVELTEEQLIKARIKYYYDYVDWGRYYIEHCTELADDFRYYLTQDGTIALFDSSCTMLCIHNDEFNEAYYLYLSSRFGTIEISAESLVVPDTVEIDNGESTPKPDPPNGNIPTSEYISEEESIDRLCHILPNDPLQVSKNINFAHLGEIDLLYKFEDYFIVVEVKRSSSIKQLKRGRKQAIRYAKVIEILQPDIRVFGLLYSFSGLEVVFDNAIPYESNSLNALFKLIDYEKL
jgi:Holliday junction resolvase-like predicted endonuclease